jgi:hypothetical protein
VTTKINGTHRQGEVNESYARLVEVFGPPGPGDGYKQDAQWIIEQDGVVATIYNYKDGPNYCGESGDPVHEIRDWHIGGHTSAAVALVFARLART